jgi:hypothetical protein
MTTADKYALARKAVEAVNARPGRKLGSTQEGVLRALIRHGRFPGGWVWNTRSETERALESLVKRGVVERTERPMTDYAGRRFPQGHPYHTATDRSYTPAAWLFETEAAL